MERLRSSASALGPHWKAAKSALNRIPIKNFKSEETMTSQKNEIIEPLKIQSLTVKKSELNQPVSKDQNEQSKIISILESRKLDDNSDGRFRRPTSYDVTSSSLS